LILAPGEQRLLVVWHRFAAFVEAPRIELRLPSSDWKILRQFNVPETEVACDGRLFTVSNARTWSGGVILLGAQKAG
jgi:hypothetical protein